MRAGLSVLIVVAGSLLALARSRADTPTMPTIDIHPQVLTILQLPDEIVHAWLDHHGEIRIARVGNELAVQPRASVRPGDEAMLEVETRTLHRTFRLRVVARPRDAHRKVLIVPPPTATEPAPEAAPASAAPAPAASAPAVPVVEEPAPSALASPPKVSPPAPPVAHEPARAEPERVPAAPRPRYDLSAHAVLGTGVTSLRPAGYDPRTGFQPHYMIGLRLVGQPSGSWWAVEADVGGALLAGPLVYDGQNSKSTLSGPSKRDAGNARAVRNQMDTLGPRGHRGARASTREPGAPCAEPGPDSHHEAWRRGGARHGAPVSDT